MHVNAQAQAVVAGELGSTAGEFARRTHEFKTIVFMLRMYCRAHHHPADGMFCRDCQELHDYARRRIERCVFGEDKPTCANCTVHCYKAVMRDRVRQVMRWAGPRMLWRHPVLTVRHMIDGRRPAPLIRQPDNARAKPCYAEAARPAR